MREDGRRQQVRVPKLASVVLSRWTTERGDRGDAPSWLPVIEGGWAASCEPSGVLPVTSLRVTAACCFAGSLSVMYLPGIGPCGPLDIKTLYYKARHSQGRSHRAIYTSAGTLLVHSHVLRPQGSTGHPGGNSSLISHISRLPLQC